MNLTLLVPELLWPEPADTAAFAGLAAPAFAWLEGHGRLTRQPRRDFESVLAALFGPASTALAPLRLLGEAGSENLARAGHWLCADPVHLRLHHERVVLADAGAVAITKAESAALIAALNAEFADLGQFHAATPQRWYLRTTQALDHAGPPLSAVAGRRIDGDARALPARLAAAIGEIEMFLHAHPVNAARDAAGQPAINSLWPWGGGALPAPTTPPFTAVHADNPLALGLARANGLPATPLPAGFAQLTGESPLVVFDALLPPSLYEDAAAWGAGWQALEQHWFAPIRAALGRRLENLTLIAPSRYGVLIWTVNRKNRWQFWRKGRSPAALASTLATEGHLA